MADNISKIDGARRQLETAIDLYFENRDSLSVHTLAWAAFKVLFDLYPLHNNDGFAANLDAMMGKEGWQSMSGVANFLKHADRDPDALLERHHPMMGMAIIGLAVLLYGRVAGELTVKMMAFDHWTDQLAHEELGKPELDENAERVAQWNDIRRRICDLPFEAQIVVGKHLYDRFLELHDAAKEMVDAAQAEGLSLTELLDRHLPPVGGQADQKSK